MTPDKAQQEAIERLKKMPRALLRGPVGSGKTLVSAEVVRDWIESAPGRRAIYISTPALAFHETPQAYGGLIPNIRQFSLDVAPASRPILVKRWQRDGGVLFTSIQRLDHTVIQACDQDTMLVLDESTLGKTKGRKWASRLTEAADRCGKTLLMSGTITSNGLEQVYSQARIALGKRTTEKVLGYYPGWLQRHFTSRLVRVSATRSIRQWMATARGARWTADRLAPYTVTLDTSQHWTPPEVVVQVHKITTIQWQRPPGMSAQLAKQVELGILYEDAKKPLDTGHQRVRASRVIHTAVLAEIEQTVDELMEVGEPFIYVYTFLHERRYIADMLKKKGLRVGTDARRDAFRRWNEGKYDALLLHPRSAGHGVNLQSGGSTMLWGVPTEDRELWEQTIGRLARRGQKASQVTVHVYIAGPQGRKAFATLRKRAETESKFIHRIAEVTS